MSNKPLIAIVRSAYRPEIVQQLVNGAVAVLNAANADHEIIEVTGSLELPAAVAFLQAGKTRKFDGYVVLGCLFKGATIHDEVIACTVFPAIDQMAREQFLAIGNGILTIASEEQAQERADPKRQDRGGEAAKATLRMLELKRQVGK
jgi:6,7-dimethyl-8-ribityllumazine synthase